MAYAEGRTHYDADSHIMELPEFLREFADPVHRERIPLITGLGGGGSSIGIDEAGATRGRSPERVAELRALGDALIAGPKGYRALGAAEHMAFTPYPREDVGALIRQSSDTLYLFSSDYPHIEGGRHPLGRFGKILEGVPSASLDRFYFENFARVFGA